MECECSRCGDPTEHGTGLGGGPAPAQLSQLRAQLRQLAAAARTDKQAVLELEAAVARQAASQLQIILLYCVGRAAGQNCLQTLGFCWKFVMI